MAIHKMVNLGRKHNSSHEVGLDKPPSVSYPSLYIHDLEGDVKIDKDMMNKDVEIKAVVRITNVNTRVDKDKTTTSLDIEFRKMEVGEGSDGEDLQDALEEGLETADKS